MTQHKVIKRDDKGRIIKGSGPMNTGGRSGSDRTKMERRFYCSLDRIAKGRGSIEHLTERMLDAVHDKDSDDPLAYLLVREAINRIAPMRSSLEISGPDGGPIAVVSEAERTRLSELFGQAFPADQGVVIDITPDSPPGGADGLMAVPSETQSAPP